MREKYRRQGAEAFEAHQLLEMLLFHSIRQGDTNPAAHNLLNSCTDAILGSDSQNDLCSIEGVGPCSANLVRVSADTVLRILTDRLSSEKMDSEFSRKAYLWLWFQNKNKKTVAALLLDGKDRFIDCVCLAKGRTVRPEDYRDVLLEKMRETGAVKAVISHRHANNTKAPSVEDVYLTGYLKGELENKGLCLSAHYILTDSDCVECPF